MKIIVALLLSLVAAVSGDCRACEHITAWKLYTSGSPPDWPINNSLSMQDTPGYFSRINNQTCVRSGRVNDTKWNIMMFTDPVYKGTPCCGDTDSAPLDYINLCAKFKLFRVNDNATLTTLHTSFTELYWPWFLYGDTQCDPNAFSEDAATFEVPTNCNPSVKINNSYRTLPPGTYKLSGCTYGGPTGTCPDRPSGQGVLPTGPPLDCSEVTFTVKDRCP